MAREARNRELIAKVIAPQAYLNQPETVIAQVLTGKFADGLGNMPGRARPRRLRPDPLAERWPCGCCTQMKRWGYLKGDVNYKQIAGEGVPAHRRQEADEGARPDAVPDGAYPKFTIMGQDVFDPREARRVRARLRDQARLSRRTA